MRFLCIPLLLASLFWSCVPVSFAAGVTKSDIEGIVTTVSDTGGAGLQTHGITCDNNKCILNIVKKFLEQFNVVVAAAATFVLVRYGLRLVNSQDEEKLSSAKKVIGGTIAALMLYYLAGPLTDAFFGTGEGGATVGEAFRGGAGVKIIATEVEGVLKWVEFIIGLMAIVTIIVSGIIAVTSYGKEEGTTQLKRTVGAVIFGVILIASKEVIMRTFGIDAGYFGAPGEPNNPTNSAVITKILEIVNLLIGLSALIAAAFVVFAGIVMILNTGNQEQADRARKMLIKSVIGLVVMMTSFAVMRFIIGIV